MATASRRNSGAYNTLYTNVLEQWVNENDVEDLVFERTPTLAVLNAMAEKKPLPADLTVRLLESKEDDVDAFEYYDIVGTNPVKGAQAARFDVKQYSAPVTISWQESMELTSPEAISDHMTFVIEKQLGKVAERLAKDVFRGTAGNTKQITGLEELLPDYTHDQTSGAAATAVTQNIAQRWQMRQAANTYGGITRTAWTDQNTPGTYWEGMAVNLFNAGEDFIDGSVAAGPPTDTYKRVLEAYSLSSWGASMPNLMVSSFDVYTRYERGGATKQMITRGSGGMDVNLMFDNVKFKNATWFWDEFCQTYDVKANASGAGGSTLYMLNTKYLHFMVDSRADMVLGPEKMPTDQHAFVRHLIWRGQLVCRNPRTQCRLFNAA